MSYLSYVCIAIGGLSIMFMLKLEHDTSQNLLSSNRALLQNTVYKTLNENLRSKLNAYPVSERDISNKWMTLEANFFAFKQQKQIYPLAFKGSDSQIKSPLWDLYRHSIEAMKVLEHLQGANQHIDRIQSLIALKKSLNQSLNQAGSASSTKSTAAIEAYFQQVSLYELSPLAELISGLQFLNLNQNFRWNDTLIKTLVFDGNIEMKALTEYLFIHNESFSKGDVEYAISLIREILQPTSISTQWFEQQVSAFYTRPPLKISELSNVVDTNIFESKWLLSSRNNDVSLLFPYDIVSELKVVQKQLQALAILDDSDAISLTTALPLATKVNFNELPISIDRMQWDRQQAQLKQNFYLKIVLLLCLLISLLILTRVFVKRQKKQLEYIGLRENFVNMVSHELKTPLASIRLMIETLQKRNQRQLDIKNYPEKILSEVDKLWLMVDNLLSLHQIKSGELTLSKEQNDVRALVQRVGDNLSDILDETFQLDNKIPESITIALDPILIELVFLNLFVNSVKYCQQDHAQIRINIDLNDKNENINILIQDNASGIDEKNWELVFTDFFREKQQHNKPGSGIGLSLCKQIMLLHNGDIEILSSTTAGTLWQLSLPLICQEQNQSSQALSRHSQASNKDSANES